MARTGEGYLEAGRAERRPDRLPPRAVERPTVYDRIQDLLGERGWVQGRSAHRARLSLSAAIDEIAGSIDPTGSSGKVLARSARMHNHLCELAGTANLVAWNDEPARAFDDLTVLLSMASVAYPDD